VVTHEVDGLIVPARDAESLARAIHRYFAEPNLLRANQAAARQKVGQFTLSHLANRLGNLEME